MRRFWCWMTASAVIALAASSAAQAPPEDAAKSAARGLAQTGKQRLEAGKYAEAIEAFRDAEKYFSAPTIKRMRAFSHEKLGQLLEARDLYTQIAAEQFAADAPSEFWGAKEDAKKSLQSLETRIPRVEVTVAHAPSGTRVTLDGKVLDATTLAQPLRLDPGKYTIVIEPPGKASVTRNLDLKEGATEKVEVDLAPAPPPPLVPVTSTAPSAATAPPPVALPPPTSSPQGPGTPSRSVPVTTYIAYGAGAASLITGAVLGGLALSKKSDFDNNPRFDVAHEGSSLAVAADVAFGFALIGAVAGTVAWLRPPLEDKPAKAARSVFVAPTVGGLTVGGSF